MVNPANSPKSVSVKPHVTSPQKTRMTLPPRPLPGLQVHRTGRLGPWAVVAALLALELVLGQLSVAFAPPGTHVAAFWPNAGLSAIAVFVAPTSRRAPVVVAIFLVNVAANLLAGRSPDVSAGFGLLNALEPAVVVWWLTRRGRERPRLHTMDDFLRLLGATVVGACAAGLLAGLTVRLFEGGSLMVTARAVAASHGAAVLMLAPLGMSVLRHGRPRAPRLEAALQWSLTLLVTAAVFAPGQELPLAFAPFPLLVWGAMRLPLREVTLQLVAYATVTCVLTTAGHGPVGAAVLASGQAPETAGALLQANLLAAALVAVPLSLVKTQQLITVDQLTYSHDMVTGILSSTSGSAILGTTLTGVLEFFNVGAERLSGYRARDVIDRASLALVPGTEGRLRLTIAADAVPDQVNLEVLIGELLDSTDGYVVQDWDFVRADGELRTISVAVSRRLSDEGVAVGYLGVAEDVTAQRRQHAMIEAALDAEKQINERLAQLDQTKNDFMATVSHELRTPITSIIGYSELLLDDQSGTLPAMHQQLVARIERNGRRLMGLIEDMLTMSQVELGDFRFHKEQIDLREIVALALETVQPMAENHALVLEQELGDLPVTVFGDPDKLERVFANLLSNAVKFSHPGNHISAHLCIEATREGEQAVFRVTDNGVGISAEDQAHLFDRFFRGSDAHALAIQGAGLGLSIASSIVAGHDGRIEVLSELGHGSTFVVRMPLSILEEAPEEVPAEPARVRTALG
jgi:PAS domain S-box-containing protein